MPEKNRRILVLEDEEGLVLSLKILFEGQGYEVITEGNAEQGVKTAREKRPGVVLLDLGIPGGGFSFLEELKELGMTGEISVIIMTANPLKESEERAKELGAVDFVNKPFDSMDLVNRVNRLLSD